MIKFIEPTKEQKEYVTELIKQEFGHERKNSGDYFERLFGLLGQIIVCDIFKKPRPTDITKCDGFSDIEIKEINYDIKTRRINVPNKKEYWNSVQSEQMNFKVGGYIFVVYRQDKGLFQIVGWIHKKEFLEKGKFHKKEERKNLKFDAHEIQDKDLNKFRSLIKIAATKE